MDFNSIFDIDSKAAFEKKALEIFKFQFKENTVYRSFCDLLCKNPSDIQKLEDIPFLPIEFFKTHRILSSKAEIKQTFNSSGTTGSILSGHHITNLKVYEKSFIKGFEGVYDSIENFTIIALLPSYLEREGSSLVYMVDDMIKKSGHSKSGFYLEDFKELRDTLLGLEAKGQKTLLIGVSYALLDLIEFHQFKLKHTLVMETGGMKGRRKELIKSELHALLKDGFGVKTIHSEYGMTELLSQAYSKSDGLFATPPWMQILIRDTEDPFKILKQGKCGGINVIDLANINSCSFIATQDLGKMHKNGLFELLGRFDQSDIRGCNLMVV
tara:strand:- start:3966 stop:4943 length:978 start_codon:yes stop_codon:yes gene_type:complete